MSPADRLARACPGWRAQRDAYARDRARILAAQRAAYARDPEPRRAAWRARRLMRILRGGA